MNKLTSPDALKGRKPFEDFLITATAIGFIADIIAITSVLLAIDFTGNGLRILSSQMKITSEHLFGLWIIAAFTYFGFLQIYWEKEKNTKGFDENFFGFLLYDLIADFRVPFLLLPVIILLLLPFWIFQSVGIRSVNYIFLFCT